MLITDCDHMTFRELRQLLKNLHGDYVYFLGKGTKGKLAELNNAINYVLRCIDRRLNFFKEEGGNNSLK